MTTEHKPHPEPPASIKRMIGSYDARIKELEEQLEAVEKREEVERIQGLTADDARKYIDQRDALVEQLEALRETAQEFVDAASVYGPERYDHAKRLLIAVLDSNPATAPKEDV